MLSTRSTRNKVTPAPSAPGIARTANVDTSASNSGNPRLPATKPARSSIPARKSAASAVACCALSDPNGKPSASSGNSVIPALNSPARIHTGARRLLAAQPSREWFVTPMVPPRAVLDRVPAAAAREVIRRPPATLVSLANLKRGPPQTGFGGLVPTGVASGSGGRLNYTIAPIVCCTGAGDQNHCFWLFERIPARCFHGPSQQVAGRAEISPTLRGD